MIVATAGFCALINCPLFCQIPQPSFPADRGTMQIFDALQWTTVAGTTSYEITISTNPNFTVKFFTMMPKGTIFMIGGAEDKGGNHTPDMQGSNKEFEHFEILKDLLPSKNGKESICCGLTLKKRC